MNVTPDKRETLNRHRLGSEDIRSLAQLLGQVRPDWPTDLVSAVLYGHRDQVIGVDLAIAALRAAKNMKFPTPVAIGWRGPHWDHAKVKPPAVRSGRRCRTCGRPEPSCYTTRYGDDDHVFEPTGPVVQFRSPQ